MGTIRTEKVDILTEVEPEVFEYVNTRVETDETKIGGFTRTEGLTLDGGVTVRVDSGDSENPTEQHHVGGAFMKSVI
jgi:hypothetical protein